MDATIVTLLSLGEVITGQIFRKFAKKRLLLTIAICKTILE